MMTTPGGEAASGQPLESAQLEGARDTARPSVAILTVNTDGGRFLGQFLRSLAGLTYPNFTLVLVDNASKDQSLQTVQELWPQAVVIRNETNLGFTGACNRGFEYILDHGFDYVLFQNSDCTMEPDFLDRLVDAAGERTITAPKTYLHHHPGRLDDSVGEFDWRRGVWKKRLLGTLPTPAFDKPREIGNANLSSLLMPVAALREVGPLDDKFFVYYDDTDFIRRARDLGYKVWFRPEAVIYHRKGATIGGPLSPFGLYYLTRNRPYLMRKHIRSPLRRALFWAYYATGRFARVALWAVRGRPDLSRAILRGLADYWLGRMGKTLERGTNAVAASEAADPGLKLSEGQLPKA